MSAESGGAPAPRGARRRARIVLLATVVGVVVTAQLGAWQLRRASQKLAIQDTMLARASAPTLGNADLASDPQRVADQLYRAVQLRGQWLPQHSVYLENRQMQGRVGFYLVTPLRLEGRAEAVLVQRGWVPRDLRDRSLLPQVPTAPGRVTVDGHIAPPPARLFEFSAAASGLIRQNLDPAGFANETGQTLLPLSVQQSPSTLDQGEGLARDWPRPAVDVQKHYGYAFQWFALCALMSGLYVWFQLVRPRLRRHAAG